jgi:AraC-like DNA-binding protein
MLSNENLSPIDGFCASGSRVRSPLCELVARRLPVSEYLYTQLGPGQFEVDATIAVAGDVHLSRARVEPLSAGVIVPDRTCLGFVLPVRWCGQYLFNGSEVTASALYMAAGPDGYHTRGTGRECFAVALNRRRFVEAVAALQGIESDAVRQVDGALDLTPRHADRLRRCLAVCIGRIGAEPGSAADAEAVYGLILDAYLDAAPVDAAINVRRARQATAIAHRAEERFAAAQGGPLSLADLCAAAGVGRTALYDAFQRLYGESPLRYFHKRRLMQARDALLIASPQRGGVKRAALSAGLTALGRFSVEYGELFGESPSATLSDVCL